MIQELFELKKEIEDLARFEGIEGVEERIDKAIYNYHIANKQKYPLEEALYYGIEQGTLYLQEMQILRNKAEETDDWQYLFPTQIEVTLGEK